jgi:hypothetical protein
VIDVKKKKKSSKLDAQRSNKDLISKLAILKSISMYDRYSFFANSSIMVLFPTRLAPSIKSAVLPSSSFYFNKSSYILLFKIIKDHLINCITHVNELFIKHFLHINELFKSLFLHINELFED